MQVIERSQHDPLNLRRPLPASGLDTRAIIKRFGRGEPIYSAGDPVDRWYRVVGGMARNCRQFADGRRRIVDFLLPGDFFGFSAQSMHNFDAETVVEGTTVACYQRRSVEALAESDTTTARQLRTAAMESLSRIQSRILILGRVTSVAKVKAFLMEMNQRSCKGADVAVILQMSRYDIADYLGLSVETVSRAISELRRRGVISMASKREVYIVKHDADD
jgi:CRP/FNR family nitrogen fixation transcriptional regulator